MDMSLLFGGTDSTGLSPRSKVPDVMLSKPATILSVVVFPQPEGPRRVVSSPDFMSRFSLSTAVNSALLS